MSKIIGVTVGTPLSTDKIREKIKPVLSVNGIKADENGNVNVHTGEGGNAYGVGHGLKLVGNDLTVDTADSFEEDNTLPASAALLHSTVGNIEVLLKTI